MLPAVVPNHLISCNKECAGCLQIILADSICAFAKKETYNKRSVYSEANNTFYTLSYWIKTISCREISTENRPDIS